MFTVGINDIIYIQYRERIRRGEVMPELSVSPKYK